MKGRKPFKKNEILSQREFLEKSREIHGDLYDYSEAKYKGSKFKVDVNCRTHGIFSLTPSDHWNGVGCKKCHFEKSKTWSKKEDEFIIQNYQKLKAKGCVENLQGKTINAIRGRARVLGITKKQRALNHENIPNYFFKSIVYRANSKKLDFDLDADFIWDLYNKQGRKCALSGWDIFFSQKTMYNTASMDRIDSSKGYTKDNVQLTHKMVNRCKLNCSESDFYRICESVYHNRMDLNKSYIEWEDDPWHDTIKPKRKNTEYGK